MLALSLSLVACLQFLLVLQSQLVSAINYTNPVIFSDFPDNDVFRGPDGAYYFSGSSFSYSPGAPILKSHDLVNWEMIGHSIPSLDFGVGYNMSAGQPHYVGGVWASSMRFRDSDQKWYWVGCIDFYSSYVYTADNVTGPWTRHTSVIGTCWYDCGLLIDDDDTMYVVHGHTNVSISQLTPNATSIVQDKAVFQGSGDYTEIEGNRLYKINGTYYILDDSNEGGTLIWKSSGDIWGPYVFKYLEDNVITNFLTPGVPNQGSLVQAPDSSWWFLSFLWNFPAGRLPVLAPVAFGEDGYPTLVTEGGDFGASYAYPTLPAPISGPPISVIDDTFRGCELNVQYEWVLNPDASKYSVKNGLTLHTASVVENLYLAVNTLTHRTHGPTPVGTVHLDVSGMADGDRAGFAAFSYQSAWIEIARQGDTYHVSMVANATQDPNNSWATISNGTIVSSVTLNSTSTHRSGLWFRVAMNTVPTSSREAIFSYGLDGKTWTTLGTPFVMSDSYVYFMGYRFAIFNFATKAMGGFVRVLRFISAES